MKHSELSIARSFTAFQCQISGTIMARSTVTRWYSVCALNFNGDQGDRFIDKGKGFGSQSDFRFFVWLGHVDQGHVNRLKILPHFMTHRGQENL